MSSTPVPADKPNFPSRYVAQYSMCTRVGFGYNLENSRFEHQYFLWDFEAEQVVPGSVCGSAAELGQRVSILFEEYLPLIRKGKFISHDTKLKVGFVGFVKNSVRRLDYIEQMWFKNNLN